MDRTKHPDWLLAVTYSIMAFCWAGKALCNISDMLICGISGLVFGVVILAMNKTKLPTYVNRAVASVPATALIFAVDRFVIACNSGALSVVLSMLLPSLAGSMFVEGLCTSGSEEGKNRMITAVLISVFMAASVFVVMKIMGVAYA